MTTENRINQPWRWTRASSRSATSAGWSAGMGGSWWSALIRATSSGRA